MEKVTSAVAPAFTKPTQARVCVLLPAAILTVGSRTISNISRMAGSLVPRHCSTRQHILSRAKFWHGRVARILATLVIEAFCAEGPIYLAGDAVSAGEDELKSEAVTGTGHWYQAGVGLVEIRWVFVHDLTGTHHDDYFFTTDNECTFPSRSDRLSRFRLRSEPCCGPATMIRLMESIAAG